MYCRAVPLLLLLLLLLLLVSRVCDCLVDCCLFACLQSVDEAAGYEELLESLTERNLDLTHRNTQQGETIADLEATQEVSGLVDYLRHTAMRHYFAPHTDYGGAGHRAARRDRLTSVTLYCDSIPSNLSTFIP